jgi:hypothetical protein
MSDAPRLSGGCLCGAVRFSAAPKRNNYGVCHCSMCRKWAAGPFMVIECEDTVAFDRDADLGVYRSSEWAERGFCKACGTPLFYRLRDHNQYFVSTEAFEDSTGFKFVSEIFYEEKPAHYDFANDTVKQTGDEVIAALKTAQAGGEA